jgi:ubiquinone/menaquinone biosynthesis C-methylase UbiE
VPSSALVARRFASEAYYWERVYHQTDLFSAIQQRRQQVALGWLDALHLPAEARVLEVGCGAGLTAVALAGRCMRVVATDIVPAMIALTRSRAARAGFADRIVTSQCMAEALPFPPGRFSVAIALGVLPWLDDPVPAVAALARAVEPGGYVIASVDNRARLDVRLDPWRNPSSPFRACAHRNREPDPATVQAKLHVIGAFDKLLASLGLQKLRAITLGFGPFTIGCHNLLPESQARMLDGVLQRLADAGVVGVRSLGGQYLVLARKSG